MNNPIDLDRSSCNAPRAGTHNRGSYRIRPRSRTNEVSLFHEHFAGWNRFCAGALSAACSVLTILTVLIVKFLVSPSFIRSIGIFVLSYLGLLVFMECISMREIGELETLAREDA